MCNKETFGISGLFGEEGLVSIKWEDASLQLESIRESSRDVVVSVTPFTGKKTS